MLPASRSDTAARWAATAVPARADFLLAAGCFVLFTLPVLVGPFSGQGSTAAIVALGTLAVLPLVVRRAAPAAVLGAVTVVLVIAALTGVRFTPLVSNAGPALGIAVFTVADRLPRRASIEVSVAAVVLGCAGQLVGLRLHPGVDQDFILLLIAVPSWLIGNTFASRRRFAQELHVEAAQRAKETERRIRAEERLRVSGDVHDIVSHTLSMIAVRSGVARLVLEERPDEARIALGAIECASRSALNELRAVLHAIRENDGHAPLGARLSRPALADVDWLIDELRAGGYRIALRSTPATGASPLVEESAYRVVQEALTNVVRHAGRVPTSVQILNDGRELRVSVVNGAPATDARNRKNAADGAGLGLTGMRERVALHHGTVRAGPSPEGGFAVVASFPLVEPGDEPADG